MNKTMNKMSVRSRPVSAGYAGSLCRNVGEAAQVSARCTRIVFPSWSAPSQPQTPVVRSETGSGDRLMPRLSGREDLVAHLTLGRLLVTAVLRRADTCSCAEPTCGYVWRPIAAEPVREHAAKVCLGSAAGGRLFVDLTHGRGFVSIDGTSADQRALATALVDQMESAGAQGADRILVGALPGARWSLSVRSTGV
jgi:hypothetical protein